MEEVRTLVIDLNEDLPGAKEDKIRIRQQRIDAIVAEGWDVCKCRADLNAGRLTFLFWRRKPEVKRHAVVIRHGEVDSAALAATINGLLMDGWSLVGTEPMDHGTQTGFFFEKPAVEEQA